MQTNNAYAPPTAKLEANQKPCQECGASINKKAEICPKCGVRQKGMVSKLALLLFTFFGGGIGLHKFYLRKYVQGALYLLFFWAWIPGLIAFIEFIVYACTSEERLNEKYESVSAGGIVIVAVAGVFGLVALVGILAAVSIPAYQDYTLRARADGVFRQTEPLRNQVERHITGTGKIPASAAELPSISPINIKDARTGNPLAVAQLVDNGIIVIRFEQQTSVLSGKTFEWEPYVRDGQLSWRCTGGTLPSKYRPPQCRAQ